VYTGYSAFSPLLFPIEIIYEHEHTKYNNVLSPSKFSVVDPDFLYTNPDIALLQYTDPDPGEPIVYGSN